MEESAKYPQDTTVVVDIIRRIAEREERNALELPPLYHSIDPAALERLAPSNEIHFEYLSYEITVENRTVTIAP